MGVIDVVVVVVMANAIVVVAVVVGGGGGDDDDTIMEWRLSNGLAEYCGCCEDVLVFWASSDAGPLLSIT